MSIERVTTLLPAPQHPIEARNHDWISMSAVWGNDFPDDYKAFLSTYGTGAINGLLWVLNPFSSNSNINLEISIYFRNAYSAMKKDFPYDYPRQTDEFFPWAVTDNGDSLVWLLQECDPNNWQVAIFSDDQGEEEVTYFTTSQFLVSLIENKIKSSLLPAEFLMAKKEFTPL